MAKINEIEINKTILRNNEIKNWLFERISKIDKPFVKSTKRLVIFPCSNIFVKFFFQCLKDFITKLSLSWLELSQDILLFETTVKTLVFFSHKFVICT